MVFNLILFYLVIEYLRPGDIFPPLRFFNSFFLPLFIFVVSFFRSKKSLKGYFLSNNQSKSILFLLFLHILSLAASRFLPELNTLGIYQLTRALMGYVLVYFFMVNEIRDIKRLEKILKALILAHIFVVITNLNVLSKASHLDFLESGVFFADGNDFSLALNVILPLSIFFLFNNHKRKEKILFAFFSGIFVVAIILTVSRGGTLGLAAAFAYFLLAGEKKKRNIVILTVMLTLVCIFAPTFYFERMSTIKSYESEGSAEGRILAWKGAWNIALDYPLTGVGPGNFTSAYGTKYKPEGMSYGDAWHAAHSMYFQTVAELGFPGLFAVLGIIISNISANGKLNKKLSRGSRNRELLTYFTMSWIGYSVSAAFLSVLYYPHMFVLAALNGCARNSIDKEMKT